MTLLEIAMTVTDSQIMAAAAQGGVDDDGLAQLALLLQARSPVEAVPCTDCDKYKKIQLALNFLDDVANRIKSSRPGSKFGGK